MDGAWPLSYILEVPHVVRSAGHIGSRVMQGVPLRPRRRYVATAFTLVELLVVIGVIGLLVGILLPGLNRAREEARRVKCMAQLRDIGNHLMIYSPTNKGWYY